MCGIAGGIGFDNVTLPQMLNQLGHRGPDESGSFIDNSVPVMLGTRRLSIVDIEGGSQPIWNENETVCVTFNGEIYNHTTLREDLTAKGHRFTTSCDTEVLVHLWEEYGPEMANKLEGMFAFAIWDEESASAFLCRDRFGIKPLYYAQTQEGILWGSELPTLLAAGVSSEVNLTALNQYMTLSYVPTPRTLIDSVYKLPPGATATVTTEGININKYYQLSLGSANTGYSSNKVRSLLKNAVRKRLMADVPLGAFLSGGLDSSAIVGLMSQMTDQPVKTFSIGFTQQRHDESDFARDVAEQFGTDHHEFFVNLDTLDIFERLVQNMNEPLADPAALPTTLLAEQASEECKVVLTGTGGDEVFSGYPKWNTISNHKSMFSSFPQVAFSIADNIADLTSIKRRQLRYFNSLQTDNAVISYLLDGNAMADDESGASWLIDSSEQINETSKEAVNRFLSPKDVDAGDQIYSFLLKSQLPDRLLHKVDTTTMNASLEARVPYLDTSLVEYVSQISFESKTNQRYKPVLRHAMEDIVGNNILSRDKDGFSVPVDDWIRNRRDPVERWFSEEKLEMTPYIDSETVRARYTEHYREQNRHNRLLFRVLVYVAWYHTVIDATSTNL
jgi:asparagine synthase (glutamine-hydrolysing)